MSETPLSRRTCTILVNVVAQDEAYLPEPADLATALMLVLPDAWTGPPPADGFTVEGILGKGLMPDLKIDPMRRARKRRDLAERCDG